MHNKREFRGYMDARWHGATLADDGIPPDLPCIVTHL